MEFLCAVAPHRHLLLERHAHYVKQGFRNRTVICTANGPLNLIAPVQHRTPLSQTPFGDVRIDPSGRWRTTMWRTIESAYRNAPFYEYYADEFRTILFAGHEFLFDLNKAFLSHICTILGWDTVLEETSCYEEQPSGIDLRNRINAKTSYTTRPFLMPQPYFQLFSGTFIPNAGVLDLVFCCGPEAGRVIDNSRRPEK